MKRPLLRLIALLGVVVGVGIALAYVFRVPLTMRLVERVAARNVGTTLLDELPDGLHVALCGAGSPLPDPRRSGPCVAVIAGRRIFIVDSGSGSSRVLSRMRIPQGDIEAVLLTHFHSDHIDGLGELMLQHWANGGHETPLPVIGPTGVEEVVAGFDEAYRQDQKYRLAHHGADVMPPSGAGGVARPFEAPAEGRFQVVLEDGGLRIVTFRVHHEPVDPAVGYRFDYEGRSVVVSGDTRKAKSVERWAQGVDVLVHEALSPRLVGVLTTALEGAGRERLAKITRDIVGYHTTPVEAAELARDAGVHALVLDHIVPPLLIAPMESVFLDGVSDVYHGPVFLGRDGLLIRLPAKSDAIEASWLL